MPHLWTISGCLSAFLCLLVVLWAMAIEPHDAALPRRDEVR
jgi:hypothetical protein